MFIMFPVLVPVLVSLLVSQLHFVMAQDVSAAQSAFSSFMQNPTISSLRSKLEAQTDEGARSSVSQAINSLIQSFVATYSAPGDTATSALSTNAVSEPTGNSYIASPNGFSSDSTFVDSEATSVNSYSATLSSSSLNSPSSESSFIPEISSTASTNSILTFGPTPEASSSSSLSLSSLSTLSPSLSASSPIITPALPINSPASSSSSSSSTYNDASAKESQRSYFFSWLSSQLGPAGAPAGAQQTADPFGQDPLIIWMSQWYQTATDSGAKSSIAEQLSFISSLYAEGQSTTETAATAQSTTQNPYYSPTAAVAPTAPTVSVPTAISSGPNSSQSELSAFVSSPSSTTPSSTAGIFDNPTLQSLSDLFITATDSAVAASAASSINALFASLHDPNAGSPQVNTSSEASAATTFGVSPSSESVATTFGASSSSHSAAYTFGQSTSDPVAYTFGSPSSSSVAYTFGEDSPISTPGSRAATSYGINSSFASVATTFGLITDSDVRNVTTVGSDSGLNTTNTSTSQPTPGYGKNSTANPTATSILDDPPFQNSSWFSPVAFQTTSNGASSNGSSLAFNFPNGADAASVHLLAALIAVFILFL